MVFLKRTTTKKKELFNEDQEWHRTFTPASMISVPEPKLTRVADKGLNLQINIGVSDHGIHI